MGGFMDPVAGGAAQVAAEIEREFLGQLPFRLETTGMAGFDRLLVATGTKQLLRVDQQPGLTRWNLSRTTGNQMTAAARHPLQGGSGLRIGQTEQGQHPQHSNNYRSQAKTLWLTTVTLPEQRQLTAGNPNEPNKDNLA